MEKTAPKTARLRSLLLNTALVVGVFLAASTFQSRNMLGTDGQHAPPLRGVTLDNDAYGLAAEAGRPALIYFFAPWCKICAASADNLVRLRRWRDVEDIEIVAVALDWQSVDEVREYVERHELNVRVVLAGADVAREWQIQAYPSYYVLDERHRVLRRDIGYSTQLGLWLRAWTV
jgi:thioredoxin-related protein